MAKTPQTVIGIPGQWPDRKDIVMSIASRSGGYLFAGMAMMKVGTKDGFMLEIHEHVPSLAQTLSIAGAGRFTDEELDTINSHTFTVYLSAPSGSIDAGKKLLHAAQGLLKAGGMAVLIESTGTAHHRDQWAEFCANDEDLGALLHAYVTYVGGDGSFYSCGMHNLGYSDVIVEADIPAEDAAPLLHAFVGYLLMENPTLKNGQTFSLDADSPRYRLFHEPCNIHEKDDLFYNPFGMWKLVPA
jgi:hypothetical protein